MFTDPEESLIALQNIYLSERAYSPDNQWLNEFYQTLGDGGLDKLTTEQAIDLLNKYNNSRGK